MPYFYVINAVAQLNKLQREELHNFERPITYLAYQKAEINRDRKKRNRPFKPEDFYFYDDLTLQNLPEPKYGAAAMKLVEMQLFPNWALFTFKDLKTRAADALAPEILCYQCKDAIVLAPSVDGNELSGMLVACRSASNQIREMHSPDGRVLTVHLPVISDKYVADEEAICRVLY